MEKDIFKKEMQDWNINAKFYQREVHSPFYQIVHHEKLHTYKLHEEGNIILDLGAGTGYFANSISVPGKFIVAIDFSIEMLKLAKKSYPHLHLVVASADKLPFKSMSFDVIIANGVFHHLKAQNLLKKSIIELRRVLKKQGAVCLFDRNSSFLSIFIHSFVMLIKKIIVKFIGKFPTSSSMNEPHFTDKDLNLIIHFDFTIENRKFVSSIPLFIMVVFANSLEYFVNYSLSVKFRNYFLPLAKWLEHHINQKALCVEQCVKLRKL